MMGDRVELMLGLLAGWWALTQDKTQSPPPPPPPPPTAPPETMARVPGDWFWPLPAILIGVVRYVPVISDHYGWHRRDKHGQPRLHAGADLVYELKRKTQHWGYQRPRELSTNGLFFAPPGLPVLAAQDGTVWRTGSLPNGQFVHMVHAKGQFGSYYLHLSDVVVKRGARVGAGQAIGTWGFDPTNQTIRHLHFQAGPWNEKAGEFAWANPAPLLARCKIGTTVTVRPPKIVS